MRISSVESVLVSVPLRAPVRLARESFSARAFNIVRLTTDVGVVGIGYARGGRLVHAAIEHELAPSLLGADAVATEALWAAAYERTALVGRTGAMLRALSAVDIALWDLKAKAAGLSLARLLGAGEAQTVPAYVSGGYYRDGQRPEDVASEMVSYIEAGFRAVKIRIGRLPWRDDVARTAAVRRAIGDEVELAVDANQGYRSGEQAIRVGRELEQLGVRWFEEPLPPEDIDALSRVASALDLPLAIGETESTRWRFRELIDRGAVDIVQPDVTVVGGISEWLKVAALATSNALPIAPHYFPEVHAQLVAATPGAAAIEYFSPDADIISFDRFLTTPLCPRDGAVTLSDAPGVGLDLDEDALQHHRVT